MCSYTPLFPSDPSSGDPVYGVHWCEAGKRLQKACPMPSYDIRPQARSLSPEDLAVKLPTRNLDNDYDDTYDGDLIEEPRLARRSTDFAKDTEDIETRPSLSRRYTSTQEAPPVRRKSPTSGKDRHKRKYSIALGPDGKLIMVKEVSSRSKKPVVIIDNGDDDRDHHREDRERRREDRELRRDEQGPYPSGSSRRNSLTRDGLAGRSSVARGSDYYTSRSLDDLPRSSSSSHRRSHSHPQNPTFARQSSARTFSSA